MSMTLAARVWWLHLDKTTAFILMALCDSAEDDGTRCFPSTDYIKWKTGSSRATVYRVVEDLEKRGILEPLGMHGTAMEYTIHLDKAPTKPQYQRPQTGRPRKDTPPDKPREMAEKSSHGEKSFSQRENIPMVRNDSHGEKSRLTMRKVVSPREKFSHGETTKRSCEVPPEQPAPGPEDSKLGSYPYLDTQLTIHTYDSGAATTNSEPVIWRAGNWSDCARWRQTDIGRAWLVAHGVNPQTYKNTEVMREYRDWFERQGLEALHA